MGRRLSAEAYLVDEILSFGRKMKEEWCQESGVLIRILRRRLRFTQTQLAKLSGISQANIAAIESGKKKATLSTLQKLFSAMGFRLGLVPVGELPPEKILTKQAKVAAEKNLAPLFSSMALEDQLPTKNRMQEMVNEEAHRLLDSESPRIWDE